MLLPQAQHALLVLLVVVDLIIPAKVASSAFVQFHLFPIFICIPVFPLCQSPCLGIPSPVISNLPGRKENTTYNRVCNAVHVDQLLNKRDLFD